jgi:RND superfamily putative drug exporter
MLGRLANFAFYRGGWVLAVAALLIAVGAWSGREVFEVVKPFGFEDPDSESARASDRYEDAAGFEAVPGVVAIVDSTEPTDVRAIAGRIAAIPGISRVSTGLDPGAGAGVSTDGRSVLVLGYLDPDAENEPAVGERVQEELDGTGVELGGRAVAADQINKRSESDLRRAELIALPILFLVSLWVFRGLVAAMLPILVGASSIVISLAAMRAVAELVDVDVFAINLVTALGFGLAIDYCLFIVSRYRDEIDQGGLWRDALVRTMRTAGRTVAFSSLTIAAALAALLVFPQRFLYSMGIGGGLVALVSGIVVLTVVPAVLAGIGPRINSLAPGPLQRRRRSEGRGWYRLTRFVTRRPLPIAAATAALMIVAGLPFLRVELTQADARSLPADTSARAVDDQLRSRFAADPGASLIVLLDGEPGRARLSAAIERIERQRSVSGATPSSLPDGLTRVDVALEVDPNADGAVTAVRKARAADWGAPALVTGRSAELLDQRDSIADHVPIAVAIIAVVTFALLLAMTGSLLLPLQALLMNLLTVSVALGVMVLVFQDGRLEGLLDFQSDGGIDRSVPILLFAIVFGLSTDYGIFVIARIQEARASARSEAEAIAIGIDRGARVVTAAAILLSIAVGAVGLSDLVYNKELAIGAATGMLVDATIVRALLFPAVMALCGRWTWWPGAPIRRYGRYAARRTPLS